MTATSASLLARVRDSHAAAWARLVDLYTPLIRRWLARIGVRPGDGEDLVQDVLAVVVRRFPDFHTRPQGGHRREVAGQ